MLGELKRQAPGVNIQRAPLKGDMYPKVLSCADILAGHLAGKNFHLDRIVTRNVVSLSMLGLKNYDLHRKFGKDPEALEDAQRKLFLIFGVDAFRRTKTTWANGVVGRRLAEHPIAPTFDYLGRMGTGFAANYLAKELTDQINPLVKKFLDNDQKNPQKNPSKVALTPQATMGIMWYNNGQVIVYPFFAKQFDEGVLRSVPMNYFDACRQGKPLRFLASPRMMRVYESSVYTILGLPKYFLWGI